MEIILYAADCKENAANCFYPHRLLIDNPSDLAKAVARDHVFASYKNNYRSNENFRASVVVPQDVDNKGISNPDDWMTAEKCSQEFEGIDHIIVPSRHNMLPKEGESARPRFHVFFPVRMYTDAEDYARLKIKVQAAFPFFDKQALGQARFMYGSDVKESDIVWQQGMMQIDEFLEDGYQSIPEGSRNSTMSHIAGKILKRFGDTDEAHQFFMERSQCCDPPLEDSELDQIWKSALKFFKKISKDESYVAPSEYNQPPGWEEPIPFGRCSVAVFPVDALPKPYRDFALAEAECTQTPVDMVGTCVLSVMSTCLQGKYHIRGKPGWIDTKIHSKQDIIQDLAVML